MVARDRHGPASLALFQLREEPGSVGNILAWVEQRFYAGKIFSMVAEVDLHAPDIDQGLAMVEMVPERRNRGVSTGGKQGLARDVEGVRLEASVTSRFCQSDSIEDANGDVVSSRGFENMAFTGVFGSRPDRVRCTKCGHHQHGWM